MRALSFVIMKSGAGPGYQPTYFTVDVTSVTYA